MLVAGIYYYFGYNLKSSKLEEETKLMIPNSDGPATRGIGKEVSA